MAKMQALSNKQRKLSSHLFKRSGKLMISAIGIGVAIVAMVVIFARAFFIELRKSYEQESMIKKWKI